MKKPLALLLSLLLFVTFFHACSKSADTSAATDDMTYNSDEIITAGLDNLDLVSKLYIEPLDPTVWRYSWSDVSQIKADDLIRTCFRSNAFYCENVYSSDKTSTAKAVEREIQRHFAVSGDYLKTSSFYSAKDDCYQLVLKTDNGFAPKATSVKQRGKRLTIEVGIYSYLDEKTTPMGTLTVELLYGRQIKYVSYLLRGETPAVSDTSKGSGDEIILPDLKNLDEVCSDYVDPLYTDVWNYSWKDASEIKPDDLMNICYFNDYINYKRDIELTYYDDAAPENLVVWSVQQHFIVNDELLEQSQYYHADKKSYELIGIFGDSVWPVVLSAKQSGKQIIIEVAICEDYNDEEKTIPKGLLTVEPLYGRQVKYVSFSAYTQAA